ncbi:MAG: hypothetical protein U0797_06685 [Gemmataceae bacterium]
MRAWPFAAASVLALAASAKALLVAPPSIPARVAVADRIVVGKVTKVAEKLVPAEWNKGDTRPMQLATVAVVETVSGPKVREIQVGFFPPPPSRGRSARPGPALNLAVGDEALFYLTRHPTKKGVYVAPTYYDVAKKKGNPNFDAELAEAKRMAKYLADPKAGLESKDAGERYAVASMLITRYRTQRPGSRLVTLPQAESERLLKALASADWDNRAARGRLHPAAVFQSLGLTEKDGWTPPDDFLHFPRQAKQWLVQNADKYRLQRYAWPGGDELNPEPE